MRRLSLVLACALLAAVAAVAPSAAMAQGKPGKAKAAPVTTTPVNLNTATAADLEALPGVGAATARLIIEHREKNGGFKKVEEILEISRLCPYLLMISLVGGRWTVSESRKKSQEIWLCAANGGRSGGRTWRDW